MWWRFGIFSEPWASSISISCLTTVGNADTDAKSNADSCTHANAGSQANADPQANADAYAKPDPEAIALSNTDPDADAFANTDADAKSNPKAVAERQSVHDQFRQRFRGESIEPDGDANGQWWKCDSFFGVVEWIRLLGERHYISSDRCGRKERVFHRDLHSAGSGHVIGKRFLRKQRRKFPDRSDAYRSGNPAQRKSLLECQHVGSCRL